MSARVVIGTTVREPGPALRSFVLYHRAIGVEHVYVYFDDPDDRDLGEARALPGVTVIPCDARLRAQQQAGPAFASMARFFAGEVMARQIVNVEHALALALAQGADWLLHLDVDELLHVPGPLAAQLDGLPTSVGQVIFRNHEAAPELDAPDEYDYFRVVSLFKRNPACCPRGAMTRWLRASGREWFFTAYENGKPAVRVAPGIRTPSVHFFVPSPAHPDTVEAEEAAVLHYANCGFAPYRRKYRHRGAFSDAYFERWPRLPFHLRSRDVAASGDVAALRRFYAQHVLIGQPEAAQAMIDAGLAMRLATPRAILAAAEELVP